MKLFTAVCLYMSSTQLGGRTFKYKFTFSQRPLMTEKHSHGNLFFTSVPVYPTCITLQRLLFLSSPSSVLPCSNKSLSFHYPQRYGSTFASQQSQQLQPEATISISHNQTPPVHINHYLSSLLRLVQASQVWTLHAIIVHIHDALLHSLKYK